MSIDIERLGADAAYWDEVAKPWATHFDPFLENWINYKDGWLGIIHVSDDSNVWRTREGVLPSGAIPRPAATKQWSGSEDGLPKVGEEIEVLARGGSWKKAAVIAHIDVSTSEGPSTGIVHQIVSDPHTVDWVIPSACRPIRTEKERVVEAMMKKWIGSNINVLEWRAREEFLGSAYDAGLLKMPEGEQ